MQTYSRKSGIPKENKAQSQLISIKSILGSTDRYIRVNNPTQVRVFIVQWYTL